ncbi:hypothetical protein [Clostridium sp. DJ247]|nr:hypothetical protein [Clostridium sp. DJ247]
MKLKKAKDLHKRYRKTYRRRLSSFNDEFVNSSFIVRVMDGENMTKVYSV